MFQHRIFVVNRQVKTGVRFNDRFRGLVQILPNPRIPIFRTVDSPAVFTFRSKRGDRPARSLSVGTHGTSRCTEMISFFNDSALFVYLMSVFCSFVMSKRSSNPQIRVLALTVWL